MSINPSKHQLAIFDELRGGVAENIVVKAVAGSGKSTTLKMSLDYIDRRKSVKFFAFNVSIVKELKDKLSSHFYRRTISVSTIHSYGLSALRTVVKNIDVDTSKYKKLLEEMYDIEDIIRISGLDKELVGSLVSDYLKLIDLCRLSLISSSEEIVDIGKKHNISLNKDESKLIMNIIKVGTSCIDTIDITDMIFLPLKLKRVIWSTYDYVFVDECQDLNICQQEIVLKAKHGSGKMVYVGDPKQSIYGFAGADTDSFKRLVNKENTVELPLSKCYRCATNIIDLAKEIVPYIESADTRVGTIVYEDKLSNVRPNDMILCRNTYPLIVTAMKMIRGGQNVTIAGNDIGKSFINTIKKSKAGNLSGFKIWVRKELHNILKVVSAKDGVSIKVAKSSSRYANSRERFMTIIYLIEKAGSLQKSYKLIQDIFKSKDDQILMSTIHKSKGLESDRVFILNKSLSPSVFAELPWELEQESNLIYVSYTRAKSHLGFIDVNIENPAVESDDKVDTTNIGNNFVGTIGEVKSLRLKVYYIKEIDGKYGKVFLYKLLDSNGNIFSKFGDMSKYGVKLDDTLTFFAKIKEHKLFNGTKETILGKTDSIKIE